MATEVRPVPTGSLSSVTVQGLSRQLALSLNGPLSATLDLNSTGTCLEPQSLVQLSQTLSLIYEPKVCRDSSTVKV